MVRQSYYTFTFDGTVVLNDIAKSSVTFLFDVGHCGSKQVQGLTDSKVGHSELKQVGTKSS